MQAQSSKTWMTCTRDRHGLWFSPINFIIWLDWTGLSSLNVVKISKDLLSALKYRPHLITICALSPLSPLPWRLHLVRAMASGNKGKSEQPCLVPLVRSKRWERDEIIRLVINAALGFCIFIQIMKVDPNPNRVDVLNRNSHSTRLKVFSASNKIAKIRL